jgi:hypothetical protein
MATCGAWAKAKQAHHEIVEMCHKMQGEALIISAQADCRLADDYDAAQERGEFQKRGGDRTKARSSHEDLAQNATGTNGIGGEAEAKSSQEDFAQSTTEMAATAAETGLNKRQIYNVRALRDAVRADPEILHKAVAHPCNPGGSPPSLPSRCVHRPQLSIKLPRNR